jgi:hypothetical protein
VDTFTPATDQKDPREPSEHGSVVTIVEPSTTAPGPDHVDPGRSTFAAAPLLSVHREGEKLLLLVGHCQVVVPPAGPPQVTVVVQELWRAEGASDPGTPPTSLHTVKSDPALAAAVDAVVSSVPALDPGTPEARAVLVAKSIAEHARNTVEQLRGLRYEAERHLANSIGDIAYDPLALPVLLELGIAAGRARDLARKAAREGLWVYHFSSAAYHAQRRGMDPTLPVREGGDDLPAWFATYDAGVRQCRMMADDLTEEVDQLHRLVQASSSISAARDVRAQEQFNFVATIGAVVLGLPALVLAVYGARSDSELPWAWVLPVFLCGTLACVVAWFLPGEAAVRPLRRRQAMAAAVVTFLLVCVTAAVPRAL